MQSDDKKSCSRCFSGNTELMNEIRNAYANSFTSILEFRCFSLKLKKVEIENRCFDCVCQILSTRTSKAYRTFDKDFFI